MPRFKQPSSKKAFRCNRFNSTLLFEPWQIQTGAGTPYKVFTPFWRNALSQMQLRAECKAPSQLPDMPGIGGLEVDELKLASGKDLACRFLAALAAGRGGRA